VPNQRRRSGDFWKFLKILLDRKGYFCNIDFAKRKAIFLSTSTSLAGHPAKEFSL
jgi:hypothetical protein